MKNKMLISIPLLSLLTLVSCGGNGNSNAKLEISSGFLASNAGFDGGLIIIGKNNTTDATFTIDLVSGVQSQMELPKGSWTFRAVGWDGGSATPLKFAGTPYCGKTDVQLNADSQTVNLNVTMERCGTDESFTSNEFKDAAASNTFLKLNRILSCNTFFNHASPIASNTVINSVLYTKDAPLGPTFCNSASMPKDLVSKVKGFKIYAINKTLSQATGNLGFSTPCLDTTDGNNFPDTTGSVVYAGAASLRLPSKIPLAVQTFEDSACTKSIATMPFKEGLESDNSDSFDAVFHKNTSPASTTLLLPANDVRRAKSPFIHLLPSVKCFASGEVNCDVQPLLSGTPYDYYGFNNQTNTLHDRNNSSCNGPYTSTDTSIGTIACTPNQDGITLTYTKTSGPAGVSYITDAGTGNYKINFNDFSSFFPVKEFFHTRLIEFMGYTTPTFPRSFFNISNQKDDQNNEYGEFSEVRDMMNVAAAVIGINNPALSFQANCLATNGSKDVAIYDNEDLKMNHYRIEITDPIIATMSKYICNTSNPGATSCTQTFAKEVQIFDYSVSAISPFFRMKLHCDQRLGRMIRLEQKEQSGYRRIEKESLAWNAEPTGSNAYQRFEKASIKKEFNIAANGTATLNSEKREMSRFQKISSSSFALWDYGFDTHLNAGIYYQKMHNAQTRSDSSVLCYKYEKYDDSNAQYNFILTDTPVYASFRTALPVSTGGSDSFNLTSDWLTPNAVVGTCSAGMIPPEPNNPMFNESLIFKIDSLSALESLF